ncbi:MAG: FAD-binding oxidoreductase [Limisphaerales bacterium]
MILRPLNPDELLAQLARNFASGEKITLMELNSLNAVVDHNPEDMTASVEAGMTLAAFQRRVRECGQWLPIDPHCTEVSIGDLLAYDFSGSRRLGYGTIRDYLIGIKVALADGTLIKAGGKVVKNVAGYDLCKLFIGARHTLGVIVEGTFKLRPLPEKEIFVEAKVGSLDELEDLRKTFWSTSAEPVIFDAQNLHGNISVIAAFAGNREDVEAQAETARRIGFGPGNSTEYVAGFWKGTDATKLSVLPSKCVEQLRLCKAERWLAHLGNGIIYYRGGQMFNNPKSDSHYRLEQRVRELYDPKQIFSPLTSPK